MKKGSGDDPFADLEESADADDGGSGDADAASDPEGSTSEDGAGADSAIDANSSTTERYTESAGSGGRGGDTEPATEAGESGDDGGSTSDDGQTKAEADGIPWVLRRSRVKEDRENVHQFFLREEYSAREDEIIESVAAELDMRQKDLQKLDVREAMVDAADPEDVAAVLRDWGYEYLK